MKTLIRVCVIFFIAATFGAGNSSAQWKIVAPKLLINYNIGFANPEYGAIHFKDGVLWAGWRDTNTISAKSHASCLWFSNDTGKTWKQSTLIIPGAVYTDINFFDRLNGVVSTVDDGIYLTRNGGVTWKLILPVQQCTSVAFDNNPNIIHVLTNSPPTGLLHTSIDGGVTWNATSPGDEFSQAFTIAKDGTIYVLNSGDNSSGLPGFVSFSTDLGSTWQPRAAEVDGDSYSICADSCDPNILYVANEDYQNSVNDLSELYYSVDAGNSWVSAKEFPRTYFAGSMTCTENAIYAASLDTEIFRSTDKGKTWINISIDTIYSPFDTHNIACVNDNIVFVLDTNGSIWETTNSGGDPILATTNDIIFTQNSVFNADSVFVCDSLIFKYISFQQTGCTPPTISNITLQGKDTSSYSLIPVAGDSLGVIFVPLTDSLNSAQVIISLSNGVQKIISLSGFGIPRIPLTITTQANVTSDTLGGSVAIPITVNGLRRAEDIMIVMHYDTVLDYLGSVSSTGGGSLDIKLEMSKGRTKLFIPNAVSNMILGYANFHVFNDSVSTQQVTFDSLTVLSAIPQCQYIYYQSPDAVASIVTPLSGCGVISISRFLHYGEIPQFALMPNPTSGDASISSTVSLGDAQVIIYDMLGAERGTSNINLSKNAPAKISLPVPNGVYVVRVKSSAGTYDLRIVVNR